jgi:hypothetical protein
MSLSDSDRDAISDLEKAFAESDPAFATRFSLSARRKLTRGTAGTIRSKNGWMLGTAVWFVGLIGLLATVQDSVWLPLIFVFLMYVGIVNVMRWMRSTQGRIARNKIVASRRR